MGKRKSITAEEHKARVDTFIEEKMDMFLDILKAGKTEKWVQPWKDVFNGLGSLPHNPATKHRYQGSNTLFLMIDMMKNDWNDPRFLTLSQARRYTEENDLDPKKVRIKKGSKASYILQPIIFKVKNKDSEQKGKGSSGGDDIDNLLGGEQGGSSETMDDEKTFIRFKTVPRFNAQQFEGLPKLEEQFGEKYWQHNELVTHFAESAKVKIVDGLEASYHPLKDQVTMPHAGSFDNEAAYTSIKLHEIFHWTGHKSREDRGLPSKNKIEYAKEEIRAHMFMLSASALLKIPVKVEKEAGYIESFKNRGKLDYKAIYTEFKAASKMFTEVLLPFVAEEQPNVSWFPDKATWLARSKRASEEARTAQAVFDDSNISSSNSREPQGKIGIDVFDLAQENPIDVFNLPEQTNDEDFFSSMR